MHKKMNTNHFWQKLQKTKIKIEKYDSIEHNIILKIAILMIKSLTNMLNEKFEKSNNIILFKLNNIDKQTFQLQ